MSKVMAAGPTSIRISVGPQDEMLLDIEAATWIGFVNVGEAFLANEAGWWIIGAKDGATAINMDCPNIEMLMRQGTLAESADRRSELIRIDYAEVPRLLLGAKATGGVKKLSKTEASALRSGGTAIRVSSIQEFPILP